MMRRALFVLLALLTSLGAQPAEARGNRRVWSGLVMATNRPHPAPAAPRPMHQLHATLQRTFGYNQFEVIGQSHRVLRSGQEDWLAASKHFSLHVDTRGVTRDGYRVHLKLYQDRQLLLETDATLSQSSPLVIRGPQVGAGQLLLLLVAQ